MVMGNKIVKIEDTLVAIGGYIISILKENSMQIDDLYVQFKERYPKQDISFEKFIYAIDFLYMINKVELSSEDILKVKL